MPSKIYQPTLRRLILLLSLFLVFTATQAAEDYKLGAGDVIRITVFDYPDLTTETRVSESGAITFPLLGVLHVGGLSVAQTENLIAKGLISQGFIRQAHVSVVVSQFISQQITVLGEVVKPGKFPLERPSTVSEILALAGGVGPNGGDKAILVRPGKDGKKETKIDIDLHALLQGDVAKNIAVAAGDTIYVPRAPMFYIYGEVLRPGMYRLERNMTVAQAISVGGGLTPRGSDSGMKVKRTDEKGEIQEIDVELEQQLKDKDVLYVRERWF